MCGTIKKLKQKILQSTQLNVFRIVAVLMLTYVYASENWSKNRSDEKKIEPPKMEFLPPVPGYTLLGQNK
jgi:hypothetical protein